MRLAVSSAQVLANWAANCGSPHWATISTYSWPAFVRTLMARVSDCGLSLDAGAACDLSDSLEANVHRPHVVDVVEIRAQPGLQVELKARAREQHLGPG